MVGGGSAPRRRRSSSAWVCGRLARGGGCDAPRAGAGAVCGASALHRIACGGLMARRCMVPRRQRKRKNQALRAAQQPLAPSMLRGCVHCPITCIHAWTHMPMRTVEARQAPPTHYCGTAQLVVADLPGCPTCRPTPPRTARNPDPNNNNTPLSAQSCPNPIAP